MVDIIANLEKFLQEQRQKIEADRNHLAQNASTSSAFNTNTLQSSTEDQQNNNVSNERSRHRNGLKTSIATQTDNFDDSILTSSKTDDSKLMSITSPNNGFSNSGTHDHPKYGLPGIGEYEEKYKQLREEEKKELNKYLSQAIENKNNAKNVTIDYNDLLTKRRNEELQYRELNEVPFGGLANDFGTGSSGLLNVNDGGFQRVRSFPTDINNSVGKKEVEELNGMQYTEADDFYHLPVISHSDPAGLNLRNSSFRSADSITATLLPELNGFSQRPSTFPDINRPRELPPNPSVGVVPRANEDNMRDPRLRASEYRRQLEQQIQDQKARQKRMADEERTISTFQNNLGTNYYNTRPGSGYNPWGRSGAGAPNRDVLGNVITHRKGLNEMNSINSHMSFYENSVHTLDGVRKVPERWHEGHWPLPENKPIKQKYNYNDELREQIEQKRRRELEERDEQRREEERLSRRLESQRQRIQAEYEAEQAKQRMRDEERRRKSERILEIQELERKDARKHVKYEEEWWERDANKSKSKSLSPPIPVIKRSAQISESSSLSRLLSPPKSASKPHELVSKSANTSPEPYFNSHEVTDITTFPEPETRESSSSPPVPALRHDSGRSETVASTIDRSSSAISDLEEMPRSFIALSSPPNSESHKLSRNSTSSSSQRNESPPIPTKEPEQKHNESIYKPSILISSKPKKNYVKRASKSKQQIIENKIPKNNIPIPCSSSDENYRVPMISQEELTPIEIPKETSDGSQNKENQSMDLDIQTEVLKKLALMRRQLHLEQKRLQQQMKRDDNYQVFDPRVESKQKPSSASWHRPDPSNYDGLDIEVIAEKNRQRKNNLDKWKSDTLNEVNINDADNVLEKFMNQQSS